MPVNPRSSTWAGFKVNTVRVTLAALGCAGEKKQVLLHFSQETSQRWSEPDPQPQDGAALWLPGKLLVQIRMMPAVRPPSPSLVHLAMRHTSN